MTEITFYIQMHGTPTVIQLKYMASLLKKDIILGGLWHAGSYDPKTF